MQSSPLSSAAADTTAEASYPDADYSEDYSLNPNADGEPTPFNDQDPDRPDGFPETFLYRPNTCGPTACSNMYNLYAKPSYLSPWWAFQHGCISNQDDYQGGTNADNIIAFLNSQLDGPRWASESTPADSLPETEIDSPDYGWNVLTAMIDSHRPFVAATSWSDPPTTDDSGHYVSVADYATRGGLPYVLIVNFGHYKWYPYLDQGEGENKRYGFHTRWLRNWRSVDQHVKYFLIRPDQQ
jgi:hypothetical protein